MLGRSRSSPLFPYTTLFRSDRRGRSRERAVAARAVGLSLAPHDAGGRRQWRRDADLRGRRATRRSEEHTSELQSLTNLLCRLLLDKKNANQRYAAHPPPHAP